MMQFLDLAETPADAITYLQILSQTQPETTADIHPLLQEQNWYCTTIRQTQPNGEEIVHHTLWHYLLPTLQNPNPDNIAHSITQYITDQTTDSLNQITQATDPLFQDIAQTFQDLFSQTLTDLDSIDPDSEDEPEPPSLLTALTNFLDSEDWPYAKLPANADNDPTTTLRLSFRGDNGQWPCYAKLNQQQQTLCFYSIAPIPAQPDQQPATAEFITRANYGMILGNFELDYSDGEIRYKTSIDVEGDNLTPALIQNLVYTNVMTMDQYLPGLLAVLEQNATPQQAIALVEQNEPDTLQQTA
ncbi:YbjN domain-containing protein [filamentous cyanobacterium LEGE 11480]|uniref:YbjN domain-containing protein n=1 Tax=Romeriopsis navalis LEGE 11480 TaxID=2777977 RepID=A0A928VS07_9CYAN|nr:YbjN domain-containing protein [Romeriopsis navalis]MBE9031492.1 YbjN domain-containing protein [Romeriopsis navalis LEGE 11480]